MKSGSTVMLVILTFLLGCTRSPRVSTLPEPTSGENTSSVISSNARSMWTITPTIQRHNYRSTTTTVIELTDSGGVADSITSTVDFVLSITPSPEALSYSATIDAFSFHGGSKTGTPSTTRQLPFSFTGQLHQGKLIMTLDGARSDKLVADCSNESLSTVAVVQRAVLPIPSLLRKGMTWSDSTTATLCSGSILTTVATSRSFIVIGEVSHGILIERQERTTSTGEGAQGQHRLRLQSNGAGTAQLVINGETGALVESTRVHTASVIVTASGRDRRFTQTAREQVFIR